MGLNIHGRAHPLLSLQFDGFGADFEPLSRIRPMVWYYLPALIATILCNPPATTKHGRSALSKRKWGERGRHGPPVHHPNLVPPLDLGSCAAGPMLGRYLRGREEPPATRVTFRVGCQKTAGFIK